MNQTAVQIDESDENHTENESLQQETATNKSANKQSYKLKIPPIVIHGKPKDHTGFKEFYDKINIIIPSRKYVVKFTDNTNVFANSIEDHEKLKTEFTKLKIQFHSFSRNDMKTHAFVLTGLAHKPESQEIKKELTLTHNINIKEVYLMRNTKEPKYLVVTDTKQTIKTITKIKHLNYTIVGWQRHYNKKQIVQCHRCQKWGHATSNCHAAYVCLKCAEAHETKNCNKSKEVPARCINCDENHPANSIHCVVYKDKISSIKNKKQKQTTNRYIPAPIPERSAWETPRQNQTIKRQENHDNSQRRPEEKKLDDFNKLNAEIEKLNTLINIPKMLKLITELNKKLENCRSERESFLTYHNFIAGLDGNHRTP